jgi:hypothetical protein
MTNVVITYEVVKTELNLASAEAAIFNASQILEQVSK